MEKRNIPVAPCCGGLNYVSVMAEDFKRESSAWFCRNCIQTFEDTISQDEWDEMICKVYSMFGQRERYKWINRVPSMPPRRDTFKEEPAEEKWHPWYDQEKIKKRVNVLEELVRHDTRVRKINDKRFKIALEKLSRLSREREPVNHSPYLGILVIRCWPEDIDPQNNSAPLCIFDPCRFTWE